MRTLDPTAHNLIANDPRVIRALHWNPEDHPETGGWLLFDNLTADPDNYFLLHSGDREITANDIPAIHSGSISLPRLAMIFEWSMPGAFQMHSMSIPEGRGKEMIRDAKMLIREMFEQHGAQYLWGQTPVTNRAALMFNRLIGAKSLGFRDHHIAGRCELFGNTKTTWIKANAI